MGLIDSHAHLTYDDLSSQTADVLKRAADAGVDSIISIATDIADAKKLFDLVAEHDNVFPAAGIHPHGASKISDDDWPVIESILKRPELVALGEMGLDYHYDFSDRPTQKTVLARQLDIAAGIDKPVVIHCREAHADTVSMLKNAGFSGRRVVFHCFTGTQAEADDIANNGWRISFTGIVTFKSAKELQSIAQAYPLDAMMVETDAPYLSPVPVRSVRPNEPAHVAHTARFLAELKQVDYETFADQTRRNTIEFFGLPM